MGFIEIVKKTLKDTQMYKIKITNGDGTKITKPVGMTFREALEDAEAVVSKDKKYLQKVNILCPNGRDIAVYKSKRWKSPVKANVNTNFTNDIFGFKPLIKTKKG